MSEVTETFNFMPIGQAIKKAREAREITREQLSEQLDSCVNFCSFPSSQKR